MKRACIIGARNGSKRFPGKNTKVLHGKPLYMYAVDCAKESGLFDRIIVSTDDNPIISHLKGDDTLILDIRPKELADDVSSMWDVGRYLLRLYREEVEGMEMLCFITPCHPFLKPVHLREASDLFERKAAKTLLSVSAHESPPELVLDVKDQLISREWDGLVRKGDYATRYYANGAVCMFDLHYFKAGGGIFSDRALAYEMQWPYSLDIDYEKDYLLAEKIMPVFSS